MISHSQLATESQMMADKTKGVGGLNDPLV